MVTASRKMSWDHPNKLDLPVHVIVDGFEDLRAPFFDSLGEWGPCMGAQFLKCPPYDPIHVEFMRRIGLLFDIDLTCKLTPAYYLILNQFEWVFPKPMLIQAVDYGRDIVTRMIHMFYVCILPIFGDIELTVVGYKRIKVREGKLLILPARLWIVMHDVGHGAGTTITLAF